MFVFIVVGCCRCCGASGCCRRSEVLQDVAGGPASVAGGHAGGCTVLLYIKGYILIKI